MRKLLRQNLSPRAVVAVLAVALFASVVAGREGLRSDPPPAPTAGVAVAVPPKVESAGDISFDPAKLKRERDPAPAADLFAASSFDSPAPAVPAEKPVKAVAPQLPFAYLGRIEDGGKNAVFVSRDEESYIVAPGQKIGSDYRVESVNARAVVFLHLPTGTRQRLALPAPE